MSASAALSAIRRQIQLTGFFVLDGGLGSELERRGYDIGSSLWSAALVINHPAALKEVHLAYLEAGARCITTASYQASVNGLREQGYNRQQAKEIMLRSVTIAREAVDDFVSRHPGLDCHPLVAASIGPYGASLADGSEYRGNYGLSEDQLEAFHRERLMWLDHSGADLLAIETIPDLVEASALSVLLGDVDTPAWVSFCCADGEHLHDGNPVSRAAALFDDLDGVFALGINCTAPRYVDQLIKRIRDVSDKLIVVYPNSGADYDARLKRWNGQETADEFAQMARRWQSQGASLVGGCCRIGPQQIAALTGQSLSESR